jgi:ribosomal protein S16
MGSWSATRASNSGGSGGGGSRSSENANTITMSSSINETNSVYNEGAIFSRETNKLLEQLENTRSKNGATRVLNALEREKTNIQSHIDIAQYQLSQGRQPTENLPSLMKARGEINRAIKKAQGEVKKKPSVGYGRRTDLTK